MIRSLHRAARERHRNHKWRRRLGMLFPKRLPPGFHADYLEAFARELDKIRALPEVLEPELRGSSE